MNYTQAYKSLRARDYPESVVRKALESAEISPAGIGDVTVHFSAKRGFFFTDTTGKEEK